MKIYRPIVTVAWNNREPQQYKAPFITLFPLHLCGHSRYNEFINRCKLLYVLYADEQFGVDVDVDELNVSCDYKPFVFHPLSDIYQRLKTLIKFHI